jgi:hypothetical protein
MTNVEIVNQAAHDGANKTALAESYQTAAGRCSSAIKPSSELLLRVARGRCLEMHCGGKSPITRLSPYDAHSARAEVPWTLETAPLVHGMACGGGTHMHVEDRCGAQLLRYIFCGRAGRTLGVLKIVGDGVELGQTVWYPAAAPRDGKWRNAALHALMLHVLWTGELRVACAKVHDDGVELLLSASPLAAADMDGCRLRFGNKDHAFAM